MERCSSYKRIPLLNDATGETEFVLVNLFESLEAAKSFVGPDYEAPVFEPEARRLLSNVEPRVRHYDVRKAPVQSGGAVSGTTFIQPPGHDLT
jgi:hypothetical protein